MKKESQSEIHMLEKPVENVDNSIIFGIDI